MAILFIPQRTTYLRYTGLSVIENVYTGNDNLVRVAKVKTSEKKSVIRAITKLRKLPIKRTNLNPQVPLQRRIPPLLDPAAPGPFSFSQLE